MIFANIDPRSAQSWPKSKCYFHMPTRTLLLWLHIWFTKSGESLSKIGAKFWSLQPLFNQTSHWLLLPASSFSDLHADGAARRSQCHSMLSDLHFNANSALTGIQHVTRKWSKCHSKQLMERCTCIISKKSFLSMNRWSTWKYHQIKELKIVRLHSTLYFFALKPTGWGSVPHIHWESFDQHTFPSPPIWTTLNITLMNSSSSSSLNFLKTSIQKSCQVRWDEKWIEKWWQLIGLRLTLKYISPFFSTSFVISTSSCHKNINQLLQKCICFPIISSWDVGFWHFRLSYLVEVEVVGIWDAPTYQELHQSLAAQLSLINNTIFN